MTLRELVPATADEVAQVVRDSAAAGSPLRIRGAGGWMDAGHPAEAAAVLSTRALTGVTSYRPEDLTLTCGAGTTLAELDAATRAHGQWCPLVPWGTDDGTVGATVATATTGPFAERLGRPRNLVLGIEAVDGHGRVIAAGARVVKNVAGFDLTRAITGSWGTLAVITQLHLRLRARPVVDESWVLDAPREAIAQVAAFARGPLAPLGALCLDGREATDTDASGTHTGADAATHAGTHTLLRTRWLFRLGGNAAHVAAAREALSALGALRPAEQGMWDRARLEHAGPCLALQWRWDPISLRLRAQFDPRRILNRGLLGEPA